MIIKVHPDYPTLQILVAQSSADKPQPGKFFVTHTKVMLSDIGFAAYGPPQGGTTYMTQVKRINRSAYNMGHCVYRKSSSNCYSSVVPGINALNTSGYADGAWLSLCNVDKGGTDGLGASLGVHYQVMWIPPPDGREPWDLAPPSQPDTPASPAQPGTVTDVKLPGILGGDSPTVNVTLPGISVDVGIGSGGKVPSGGGGGTPVPETKKAGIPWWVGGILGLGAITTVIVFALKDKKKRKRSK